MEFKGVGQQPRIQRVKESNPHRPGAAPVSVPAPFSKRQRPVVDSFTRRGNPQPPWLGEDTLGSAVPTDKPGALKNLVEAAANRFYTSA